MFTARHFNPRYNFHRDTLRWGQDDLRHRDVLEHRHVRADSISTEEPRENRLLLHQGELLPDAVSRTGGEGDVGEWVSVDGPLGREVLRIPALRVVVLLKSREFQGLSCSFIRKSIKRRQIKNRYKNKLKARKRRICEPDSKVFIDCFRPEDWFYLEKCEGENKKARSSMVFEGITMPRCPYWRNRKRGNQRLESGHLLN